MGIGKDSYWQIARETTYGTHAPSVRKSELLTEASAAEVDEILDPSLHAGGDAPRAIYPGARRYRGPLSLRMNYEGPILKLLEGALGSSASALVGGETIVRDHTIKAGATLPAYSIEFGKGDIPTGKVLRGLGTKVASIKLSGGVGDESMARVEAQLMGSDLDPNTGTTPAGYTPTATVTVTGGGGSGGSPIITTSGDFFVAGFAIGQAISGTGVGAGAVIVSFNSATSLNASVNNSGAVSGTLTGTIAFPGIWPVLGQQVVTLNNGVDSASYPGGTLRVRRWSVSIENSLAESLYLGGTSSDEPLPDNFRKVTWEFLEVYQNLKQYQAARLYTDTAPKIIFEDPTTIGSTAKRQFELRSNKARAKYSNPVEGYGILLATSTHTAYYDTVDASSVVARVRNLDGSV